MPDEEKIITIKDVYAQVSTLIGFMQAMTERNKHADEIHRDHEARLRMLERWRYSLPAALLMSGGSALIAALAFWR